MTGTKHKSTRRAFFLHGGAVLGSGVATAVGAAALSTEKAAPVSPHDQLEQLQRQLASVEGREAIRQLHLAFTTLVEQQSYDAAADLFADDAHLQLSGSKARGKRAIQQLFATEYREQQGRAFHNAYRRGTVRTHDVVNISDDGRRASAIFHVEAEVCTPLQDSCTAAQMARMQGHVAERRWEAGRFEGEYVRAPDEWKVASLRYVSSRNDPAS